MATQQDAGSFEQVEESDFTMVEPFTIGNSIIGPDSATYFIADIAANHDGNLEQALHLMTLAKEAGADAAKFQHFRAATIVSDYGFRALGGQLSHQATWSKSVFEVYQDASLPWEWTPVLAEHAQKIDIEFMSSPYDLEAVAHLDPYVRAFKIGSGDVTWLEEIEAIASLGKAVILATGASTIADVERAVDVLRQAKVPIVLMQCNTNYTGSMDNFSSINLNVLKAYAEMFPDVVLGLSDHTPGAVTVLGSVALGARVIEKHFTDDTHRPGPDHGFSMTPLTWRAMVDDVRLLEHALGSGDKKIEDNELETAVLQRRCVRMMLDLSAGTVLEREHVTVLRPAPDDSIPANMVTDIVGSVLQRDVVAGEYLKWADASR
ncbi:MAG: N-acetylneuraminate synthase family protein [Actinomycetes bacterium]